MKKLGQRIVVIGAVMGLVTLGCEGKTGPAGTTGQAGTPGSTGSTGPQGPSGPGAYSIVPPASGALVIFAPGNGSAGNTNLYSANLTTGQITYLGGLPVCGFRGAFNPSDGTLWGGTSAKCNRSIYSFNLTSSTGTFLTSTTIRTSFAGLAFSPDGTLLAS